ncbi:methylated-DNA--[protein]-cysteine S-methyltransferase [Thermodesulfobacteriota bacterium]
MTEEADFVQHYFSNRVGWLELVTSHIGVKSLSYVPEPTDPKTCTGSAVMDQLVSELDRYFNGESIRFSVPLDLGEGTLFQRGVWEELCRIPYGETKSYRDVAVAIGNGKAVKAVGSANGRNPVPIVVPCHRVIRSDGSLGGYSSGIEMKKSLLELEGGKK